MFYKHQTLLLAKEALLSNKKYDEAKEKLILITQQYKEAQEKALSLNKKYDEAEKVVSLYSKNLIDLDRLKPLRIEDLSLTYRPDIFDKKFIIKNHVTTGDQLYAVIIGQFNKNKVQLRQLWHIEDEQLLLTLFLMNVTNNLWGFGNPIKINEAGCVFQNENHPNTAMKSDRSVEHNVAFYINSEIGCCQDYARMLQFLLNKAKIKNRLVLNPGHILNEAYIQGKWMAFDATVNFWWHDSWGHIQNLPIDEPFSVSIFPNNGTVFKNNSQYRTFIGQFRTFMLLEAVYKTSKEITYPA